MKRKKIAAFMLSGVMMASVLTGCGGVNKDQVVATFDETEVKLGIANFAARFQQASYDDFYVAYFGEDVWSSDMYGNGTTMESSVKDEVIQNLYDMYVLEAHMSEYGIELTEEEKSAMETAAKDFVAANDRDALEALGADEEIVYEFLELTTIQNKMYQAIIAEADTNVTDEEANTSAYSYVTVAKTVYNEEDGSYVEYTDEDLADIKATADEFAEEAQQTSLEEAAEQYAYTVETDTFTAEDTDLEQAVLTALESLEEGEVSAVIDTESEYYVVRLDAKTDADATEDTRQKIISERQSTLYQEVLEGWKADHTWTVDEKVWAKVTFDNLFTTVVESTEEAPVETTEE